MMNKLVGWLLGVGVLAMAMTTSAGPDPDDLARDVACDALASEDAQVVIAYHKAWPGQLAPANLFHLGNDDVAVDVCIPSGGAVTFTNLNVISHSPVSEHDSTTGYEVQCFDHARDAGGPLRNGESWRIRFRYSADLGFAWVSIDDGASWRDCRLAILEATDEYAVIPWHCYIYPQSVRGYFVILTE